MTECRRLEVNRVFQAFFVFQALCWKTNVHQEWSRPSCRHSQLSHKEKHRHFPSPALSAKFLRSFTGWCARIRCQCLRATCAAMWQASWNVCSAERNQCKIDGKIHENFQSFHQIPSTQPFPPFLSFPHTTDATFSFSRRYHIITSSHPHAPHVPHMRHMMDWGTRILGQCKSAAEIHEITRCRKIRN